MDLDDIPVLRHLGWLGTATKFGIVLSGFLVFPAVIIHNYTRYKEAEYVNERRFFQFRMWGLIFLFNPFLMIMLSVFHNWFGHPSINPCEGEWLFISWFFTSDHGQSLFYGELGLMVGLAVVCFCIASWIGELLHSGEFIPRHYRRMY